MKEMRLTEPAADGRKLVFGGQTLVEPLDLVGDFLRVFISTEI